MWIIIPLNVVHVVREISMQGIFLLAVYAVLFIIGLVKPFVMMLGYIWTDLFTPQELYPEILGLFPVSLVMGAGAVLSYLLSGVRSRRSLTSITYLLIAFGGWMTVTLLWAEVPEYAWLKWDWAVKTVLFTAVFPFFFRTRVQIEAFLLTIIFSTSGLLAPAGIKTFLTGGGYGWDLVPIVGTGAGLGEGITLSLYAVLLIPLIICMARHSIILPWYRARIFCSGALIVCSVAAALGSFARTGFICLVVLGGLLFLQAKRRLIVGVTIVGIGLCMLPVVGPAWVDRMNTIDVSESSAEGRVFAWKWTLDYVLEHPLGGSFDVYRINAPVMMVLSGGTVTIAKAAHSIYFEVLGETGVIGFLLWISIIIAFYRNSWLIIKGSKNNDELQWLNILVRFCSMSMTIFLIGGAFLSVAFLPIFYYLVAILQCSHQYYRERGKLPSETSPFLTPAATPRRAGAQPSFPV